MPHIKLCEDERALKLSLQDSLQRTGYTVDAYENGKDLYDSLKQQEPDLIITDLLMPVMNGLELVQKLRTNYPHLKVLVLTNYSDGELYKGTLEKSHVEAVLLKASTPLKIVKAVVKDILSDK